VRVLCQGTLFEIRAFLLEKYGESIMRQLGEDGPVNRKCCMILPTGENITLFTPPDGRFLVIYACGTAHVISSHASKKDASQRCTEMIIAHKSTKKEKACVLLYDLYKKKEREFVYFVQRE
jgi:hypothetical protein